MLFYFPHLYKAEKIRTPIKTKSSSSKSGGGSFTNVLMQLRKLANHPLLCRYHYNRTRLERVAQNLLHTGVDEFLNYPYQHLVEDLEVNSDFEIWQLCEQYRTPALNKDMPDRSMLVESSGKLIRLMSI